MNECRLATTQACTALSDHPGMHLLRLIARGIKLPGMHLLRLISRGIKLPGMHLSRLIARVLSDLACTCYGSLLVVLSYLACACYSSLRVVLIDLTRVTAHCRYVAMVPGSRDQTVLLYLAVVFLAHLNYYNMYTYICADLY